jgi:hypothetical protein
VITTEKGAHTLGFDASRNKVYAFLPQTHRAAVYKDEDTVLKVKRSPVELHHAED